MIILAATLLFMVFMVELATIILTYTGMTRSQARFQALSAITTTGFTTREAELMMKHPIRRKITMLLMVISYLGLAGIVSSFLSLFRNHLDWWDIAFILNGALIIYFIIKHPRFSEWLGKFVYQGMEKRIEREVHVDELLRLGVDYSIQELPVFLIPSIIGKSLREVRLKDRGILVLSIRSKHTIQNMPSAEYRFEVEDYLIVYGPTKQINKLKQSSTSGHSSKK